MKKTQSVSITATLLFFYIKYPVHFLKHRKQNNTNNETHIKNKMKRGYPPDDPGIEINRQNI